MTEATDPSVIAPVTALSYVPGMTAPATSGPLAGGALLDRLLGNGSEHTEFDPLIAENLRQRFEDTVAPFLDALSPEVTVRVSKGRLRQVLRCEAHLVAMSHEAGPGNSAAIVAGALSDRLFAQIASGFPVSDDAVSDALAGAEAAGDDGLADAWAALPPHEQADVAAVLTDVVAALTVRWPQMPAGAFPRFQESIRAELGAGRVILSGRVDLVLAMAEGLHPGSVLVDVKSGKQAYDDRADADWYAVLETLRHGMVPLQVGNYYLRTGHLDVEVTDGNRLDAAARRITEGLTRLLRLAVGGVPTTSPNALCLWCPAFDDCEPGRRHVTDTDPTFEPGFGPDDPDDDDDF